MLEGFNFAASDCKRVKSMHRNIMHGQQLLRLRFPYRDLNSGVLLHITLCPTERNETIT